MFGKVNGLASLFLFSCIVAVFFFYGRIRPSDALRYQQLTQESTDLRSKHALETHPAHQVRRDVQKDIWTVEKGGRTHFRLKSEGSELTIRQIKDKFEAIERLQNLESCLHGEDLRYLLAKEGTYFFPSHCFRGEDVELFFYREEGAEIPAARPSTAPFLQGTAKEAALSAVDTSPSLAAQEVKGVFDGMNCQAKEVTWRREDKEVLFRGGVVIEQEDVTAEADEALLTYQTEFSPDALYLKGNVHLLSAIIQGKESFAIADALTYRPQEKTLVLSADASKKVLFWQEDMRLSATEVLIRRDPITQLDSVQGVGDVHGSFDLAEENAIQQLFGKYL